MSARMPDRILSIRLATAALILSTAVLAGCSSGDGDGDGRESRDHAQGTVPAGILPPAHVHGVEVDPADAGAVLLATHDGLFRVDDGASTRVGPVIDLMGFTVAGPNRYLASGHPGPGVDLPQPVGLIESTDGGRTWEQLSRQGESDFHALTVSTAGVLGYDGSLMRSSDGLEWEQLTIPAVPASLSASPDGGEMLAATAEGLLRSVDGGVSWSPSEGAPPLQVVDWATDGTAVVGVDPSGGVWSSPDGGATWRQGPQVGPAPQAVGASGSGEAARIVVVTATGLLESTDGGRSFAVVLDR
ncbi:F510_1955 family glycosylhydrolase [Trujillonella humicola]|uniref:F510_1955 family glycosylhydrolase n=1 Tax=Trujillonella humicola TaxID=3383699 RepID=UPI003906A805